MVNLDNTYSFQRPPVKILLTVPILYVFGYIFSKVSGFQYIYQYSITVLISIIIALFFDKDILSRKRLISDKFFGFHHSLLFLTPLAVAFVIFLISRYLHYPILFYLYSSGSKIHKIELFILMIVIFVPIIEIFFRGFIQHNLSFLAGWKIGYVGASVIFAGFFMFSGSRWIVLIYLIIGLYLGYIYKKYNSILLNIILHGLIYLLMFIYPF